MLRKSCKGGQLTGWIGQRFFPFVTTPKSLFRKVVKIDGTGKGRNIKRKTAINNKLSNGKSNQSDWFLTWNKISPLIMSECVRTWSFITSSFFIVSPYIEFNQLFSVQSSVLSICHPICLTSGSMTTKNRWMKLLHENFIKLSTFTLPYE